MDGWEESTGVKVHEGTNYVGLEFDGYPIPVEVPPGQDIVSRKKFRCQLKAPFNVYGVDIFHGHDRGDTFEMDTTIYSIAPDADVFVARRIEENETPSLRRASERQALEVATRVQNLVIYSTCRVTGASRIDNKDHPSFNKWRGNFDLTIKLIGRR